MFSLYILWMDDETLLNLVPTLVHLHSYKQEKEDKPNATLIWRCSVVILWTSHVVLLTNTSSRTTFVFIAEAFYSFFYHSLDDMHVRTTLIVFCKSLTHRAILVGENRTQKPGLTWQYKWTKTYIKRVKHVRSFLFIMHNGNRNAWSAPPLKDKLMNETPYKRIYNKNYKNRRKLSQKGW